MSAARVLAPQTWMTAAATRRLVAALGAGGTEIRFVGGCVRDALIGRASSDIDVATPDPPDVVTRKLRAAGLRAIPTGIEHGTVTALVDDRSYEITTLRRDVATDGRHAEVAFTDDWREDAARRDFTMNALSATPDGALHDYFGGLADLEAGRVVFVGEPARRIAEDYLRVLRFYRFHARYGRGAPDAPARAACRAAAASGALARLSGERVRTELLKLLAAHDPVPATRAMVEDGVLAALLPMAGDEGVLAALVPLEPAGAGEPLRRLASLLPAATSRTAIETAIERLRLSGRQGARLLLMAGAQALDRTSLRRALHADGAEAVRDRVLLAVARGAAREALAPALAAVAEWTAPAFPLSGADVLALGVVPGPRVGALLETVEDWWIAQDFAPGRDACLRELSRQHAA
ncbi:MAG: CCA tRNA nucleotidyltransferase, partial [Alphaproteobacteria bacterium]|nr:CCA tRNA nucleotidyltransferase [Alphaproteobacteria bacterium]